MPKKDSKYKVGMIIQSKLWGLVEIIDYINSRKIQIRFLDSGYETWTNCARMGEGYLKDKSRYRIFGVGINDLEYTVEVIKDGVRWTCPYYRTWRNMLARCYTEQGTAYEGCTVVSEWLLASKFKAWMEQQDWEGKQLDKDLLSKGIKQYGPETCVFLEPYINQFIKDKSEKRGKYPIGVTKRTDNIYIAQGKVNGENRYLGSYRTAEEAHQVWWEAKKLEAVELCENISCERIKTAILAKYS